MDLNVLGIGIGSFCRALPPVSISDDETDLWDVRVRDRQGCIVL